MCLSHNNCARRIRPVATFFSSLLILCCSAGTRAQNPASLGTIDRIAILGNIRTKAGVLQRELLSQPGHAFTWENVERDRWRLLTLEIIRATEIQVKVEPGSDDKTLVFVVSETNPLYVYPLLGNNSLFGIYGGFEAGYKNFRGRREKLKLRIRFGNLQRYLLQWSNPRFAGPLRLSSELQLLREEYDYLFTDYAPDFHLRTDEIAFTLGFRPFTALQLGVRSSYERVGVSDKSVSSTERGIDEFPALQPFIELNTRDWEFYPRHGWYARLAFKRYLDSRICFELADLDLRRYQPLGRRDVAALRLTTILSKGVVPVYKRTHLGGSQSLRGYSTGQFAGEDQITGSFEYRIPLGFQPSPQNSINVGFAAVFFIDTGTAWWQGERWLKQHFHSSVGAGFHCLLHEIVLSFMYGHTGRGFGFLHVSSQVEF